MCKRLWKLVIGKDVGLLDVAVKLCAIGALWVTWQQYDKHIYPIWAKEERLKSLTAEVQELEEQRSEATLEANLATTKTSQLQHELDQLAEQLRRQTEESADELFRFRAKYEESMRAYESRLTELSAEVSRKRSEANEATWAMIGVYLHSFAQEVADIQIDHIRWQRDTTLDLRRDILDFVARKLDAEDNPAKIVALNIFRLYAEMEVPEGTDNYSQAIMVGVFFRYNHQAVELMSSLLDE